MKIAFRYVTIVVGLVLLAVVVLPLRLISEHSYVGLEQRMPLGRVWAETDPTYRPMRLRYWFDGQEGDSPYRVRIFFLPDDGQTQQPVVMSGRIGDGSAGGGMELAAQKANGPVQDRDGRTIYISGYLDLALRADEMPLDVTIEIGGRSHSVHLQLRRTLKTRVVHSGLEALMGI